MSKPVSLADVAAMPAEASDEDDMPEGDSFDAAASELADVVGVPDDRFADFKTALQAVIMTCK